MASIIETVKKASLGAVNASNPLAIEFGTVTSTDSLTIRIDQKRILPKEFFVIPEQLTRYVVDLSHSHSYAAGATSQSLNKPVVIREGLKIGDVVSLLRIDSGTRFLILDKVVE